MDLANIQKIIDHSEVVETDFDKATAYFTLTLDPINDIEHDHIDPIIYALIHNTLYPFAVIRDNDNNMAAYLIPEMETIVYVNTFVLTNSNDGDKWEKVGEGTNPYELISNGTLREGDIVRFTSAYNDEPVIYIPEIDIGDPDGIFLVAQELSDFSDSVYDSIGDFFKHAVDLDGDVELGEDVPDDEDDDDDTDEYQTDDEDDLADELTFIAAGPVIAYLHRYGEQISWAKDIIEKTDNDDSFVEE